MRSDCFPPPTLLVQLMRTGVCVPTVMLNEHGQITNNHDNRWWCQAVPAHVSSPALPAPPARHNTRNHDNMWWCQALPAHVSSPALPAPLARHNICNHGNILVHPGPSVVQHVSIESQTQRVWRNMPKTHPGNAACRAEISEPCSGDQRGRDLAFNPNRVVGSDRDAASNGAGSGPYQTLPGCSVVVVKHGGTISLRVDRSSTDIQGGLQEQTRGQPRSSKPSVPSRRANERVGATSRDQGLWIPGALSPRHLHMHHATRQRSPRRPISQTRQRPCHE